MTGGVFLGVAAWTFLRRRPIRVEIVGASMRPTLEPGEWALAVPAATYRVGDIVILRHPERERFELVKRIVAGPGDRAPDGSVSGGYWVQGDAADASTDSRSFGAVGANAIAARVRLVYAPWERRRTVR
jgi:signal peptidase I